MAKKNKIISAGANGFYMEDELTSHVDIRNIEDIISKKLTLSDLAEGFKDNSDDVEGGVFCWNDQVSIRPKFQRAYVVDSNKSWQNSLIHSVINKKPIGLIYFGIPLNCKNDKYKYVNIDGQQRLITLLSFIKGDLVLNMYDQKEGKSIEANFKILKQKNPIAAQRILDYQLEIKICIGNEEALLEWFKTINQPIATLTNQELRNASFCGPFVEAAKRIFSVTKSKNPTLTNENGDIMNEDSQYCYKRFSTGKEPSRQDVLEMALDMVSYRDYRNEFNGDMNATKDDRIKKYMLVHKNDLDANDLKQFWFDVFDWVCDIFMHGYEPSKKAWQSFASQPWARLYLDYKDKTATMTEEDKIHITERCKFIIGMGASLYQKSDGIYEWVLRGEKEEEENEYLHLRCFSKEDKENMYISQGGIDPIDNKHYSKDEMEAHHIKRWCDGGPTDYDNLVMLSKHNHKNLSQLGYTPSQIRTLRDALRKRNGNL